MKSKRFLSLLLSVAMILSLAPVSVFAGEIPAEDTVKSVTATLTAQADGEFLCAPQLGTSISSDTAENYGFEDSVTDGVSVLDALVKLHEVKYGNSFTKETASDYLEISEYGSTSKSFGYSERYPGFVLNGAYPNDGTESEYGGYNGTVETTQEIKNGDTVEFFIYSDDWSDELAWFNYKGNAVTSVTVLPTANVTLNLKTSSYMMAYQYIDADAIHAVGSAVSGAQLAWVDTETGKLTDISSAVTDTSGNVSITVPEEKDTYYLTSYIPNETDGEPLIMSLTEIIVSNDAPQVNPCALSALSIASFDSNPDALELTPEFSSDITEYSVPVVAFPSMDLGVFRSVYVTAAAEAEEAVITAECNGISADITSGDSTWKMLNGALTGGKNNILKIIVAASDDEDAEKRVYSVTVPMKPQANTAPEALKETDSASITIGDTYSIDLYEIFTDADEVDTLTYKVSIDGAAAVSAEKDYLFTPDKTGVYQLVFTANDGTADSSSYTVNLTVNENVPKPTSITIEHNAKTLSDGKVVCKKGDKFNLIAYDQDGNVTPVTWKNNSSWATNFKLDEQSGEMEVVGDVYSSTSYLYYQATSTLDETVSKEITLQVTGYVFSNPATTVALSEDGQTAKTASLSGGQSGYNIWSYSVPDGVAELAADPGTSSTIKFNVFRPGTINASFKLSIDETLTDTATITVTGVAVEDTDGKNTKTYLGINANNPNPTKQLLAYTAEGRTVSSWESADEFIATVDENGLVTAKGVGSTIITAIDSEGTKGGIKVVVESEEIPYFENLQFLSSAIKDYDTKYIFAPTTKEYNLEIKTYSTTKLTLQNTTLFDDEKYNAVAEYIDINGEKKSVAINNGAITYLDGIPFDESKVTITLSDKENTYNKTVYNFTVKRPRDTSKNIKSNGVVLVPDGRSLLATKYNGYAEGTMFKLTEDGGFKTSWGTNLDTGVTGTHYSYKCFALGDLDEFSLNITGNTVYEHIRYSIDKENWKEIPQGGGVSEKLSFADENAVTVTVQIIDDETYANNVKSENDGFFDCEPNEYTVIVEKTDVYAENAKILTAITDSGDWYPGAFDGGKYTYCIVVPKDVTEKTLTFTVSEGASVKVGTVEQTAVDEVYTLPLTTSQKTLTVTSADGKVSNTYNFKIQKKADNYPDKIVDFLCVNSQYTNGVGFGNAAAPWISLSGSYTSIGNFGGYITYYYEDALTNDPNNKYGIDFYVYGNANKDTSTTTKTSFFEPAQAWVSEDGENWYALAGSAHYDDGVDWNYSVTYSKTASGKTAWTDSHGNSHDGVSYSGQYPSASVYCMNDLALSDTIILSGIALPARNGKLAVVGEATDTYPVKWGYADCFVNGTKGADVNPYTDNTNFDLQTNGFDLEWAVDENGNPVDVSDKEFHYVKLVTASNIWHTSLGEKSPEIAGVMKTTAQSEAVGKTAAPLGVTITDGADSKVINFNEGQQIYSIDIGDMKYVSISVNGADEMDNIYINNNRITYDDLADGFKITKESGTKLVRVIVQNGDKEPLIYLLKITGTATETNDLIEGVKIDVNGSSRAGSTKDGIVYTTSVGYRISSVGIYPVADNSVEVTINGEAVKDEYELQAGENVFTITGEKDGISHSVTLKITKESAPASSGKITVYFTLLGDDSHGESGEVHTLKKGGLETWIEKTCIEVDSPATVLDVFEKALNGKHTFVNADGNYISEIDGLVEFTNGPLSGWMYTLNGSNPSKGVAEQTVKNGDKIVFHYTDDYTQEQGSEKWTSSSSGGSSVTSYTVKFETNGGNTISSQSISKNGTVAKPTEPIKDGFNFAGWYTDKELTKEYDFSAKVTDGFTLYAKWIESEKEPINNKDDKALTVFTDVEVGSWYEEAVAYAVKNNLFKGVSDTEFAPDSEMTRAMLVTVLYHLENTEEKEETHYFTDVADDEWYSDAVAWAVKNGIVNGVSETEFAPNDSITREQMAAVLYRYAQYKEQDTSIAEDTNILSYTDADEISEYAIPAIQWMVGAGLMKGETESTVNPQNNSTRAQVATILMRYLEL
ncbi:MAG: S-layer homology domain-containing protein [Firmicutes bacterium]|nr:S-layer homology domain-containing protein [Bacillota bacterium]